MNLLFNILVQVLLLSCVNPRPNPQVNSVSSSGSSSSSSSGSISGSSSSSSGSRGKGTYPYDYGNYEDFGTGSKKVTTTTVKPTSAGGLPDLSSLIKLLTSLTSPESISRVGQALVIGLNFTTDFLKRAVPAAQTAVQQAAPLVRSAVEAATPLVRIVVEQAPKVVEQGSAVVRRIMEDKEGQARLRDSVRLGLNFTGEFSQRVLPLIVTTAQRALPLVQSAVQQVPKVIEQAGKGLGAVRSLQDSSQGTHGGSSGTTGTVAVSQSPQLVIRRS